MYGNLDVLDLEMVVVVKKVEVYDFILMLFDFYGNIGYDVMVGECGVKLFGG